MTIRTSATGSLLSHSDVVSTKPVEQAVEGFVGLNCRNLGGGRLASHRVPHPSLEPRPTGALALAGDREGGRHRSRPVWGRRLPQQDAADTRPKVHRPADGERVDVEWCLLEPSGVVGDESECTETDLMALDQSSAKNRDEGNRTNCNFSKKLLRHRPHGGRQLSWF